ncbi:MAG: AAA family ATPase [Actinomadura sp.]
MAKNEHDGRSLEEQLASLDALTDQVERPAAAGDAETTVPPVDAPQDHQPGTAFEPPSPPAEPGGERPTDPWLNEPPQQPYPQLPPAPGYVPQPDYGLPQPPQYAPQPPAGGLYAVPPGQHAPEGPLPYPWPDPPYGPPQGEAPGPPVAYVPPQHQQPPPEPVAPPAPPPVPETSESLSTESLLRSRRSVPAGGWRRAVFKATGGAIHPGEGSGELRHRSLLERARTPVAGGHHRVAVMSLKGGVGKTTTTVGLGATLASLRGDRVIAVDANPDRGTLSDKVRLETPATVRDLLRSRDQIRRYADVRRFTSQAPSRLEVLASDRDPAVSEAFSEEDYRAVSDVLELHYSISLTDCGTGLLHSAMKGVLELAHQLVLVSSPSVDGARSASATLDWLDAHGHGHLVRGGVVVLSMVKARKTAVDLDRLQQHFESRCRAVVRVPYDLHLEEGAEVELDQLAPGTREAYLTLAATIAEGFATPH